jgi:DNA-binding CsgD family transcriptional regulator
MPKPLTLRESEVLKLIAIGKGNREIAEHLKISVRTVEAHRGRVMIKLGFTGVADLVRYAVREKLIEA